MSELHVCIALSLLSLNIHLRLTFKQFFHHAYMFISLHATGIQIFLNISDSKSSKTVHVFVFYTVFKKRRNRKNLAKLFYIYLEVHIFLSLLASGQTNMPQDGPNDVLGLQVPFVSILLVYFS